MRKLVFLLFVLLAYLIFRPILGNVWYPMHDTTAIARVYLLEHTILSGQIPAVWSSILNQGRGYPLFHFYAPLFFYFALALKSLIGSYFIGVKIAIILASLAGMIGMYFLTRKWGRGAGIVASVAYALLPYAAVNLYVRGSFSEYLSMAILPWIFYVWQDLKTTRAKLLAGLVTALFLLSHNLIPLVTAPFLLGWIIMNRPAKPSALILPTVLTIGLTASYLFPLLFERGFVQADEVAKTTAYTLHFVAPSQLWNSTWGFGGSAPGVEDGLSFKLGKLQLILAGVGAFLALIRRRKLEVFFVISGLVAAFMSTSYSAWIWRSLPTLQIVQFPWRFLALIGFFISVLAGYSLTLFKSRFSQLLASGIVILPLLYLNLKLFTPQFIFPADLSRFTSESYLSTIPSIVPEFAPHWLAVDNPAVPSSTILPYIYYPTWVVKLDGLRVKTYPSKEGYLAFTNPNNSTSFTVVQSHTLLENLSSLISLVSLIILLKLYVKA